MPLNQSINQSDMSDSVVLIPGYFFTVIEKYGLTVGQLDRNNRTKTIGAHFIRLNHQLPTLRFCYNWATGCRLLSILSYLRCTEKPHSIPLLFEEKSLQLFECAQVYCCYSEKMVSYLHCECIIYGKGVYPSSIKILIHVNSNHK